MRSKFILTVAASLLAGTIAANAQTGQPNEKGVDQKTDGAATSTTPNRPSGPQGTVGSGPAKQNNPAMKDDTPLQPGGVSPSAPPQGGAGGSGAQPRPR